MVRQRDEEVDQVENWQCGLQVQGLVIVPRVNSPIEGALSLASWSSSKAVAVAYIATSQRHRDARDEAAGAEDETTAQDQPR